MPVATEPAVRTTFDPIVTPADPGGSAGPAPLLHPDGFGDEIERRRGVIGVAGAEESALGDADVCGDGDGREIEDEHLLAEPNVVTPFKPPWQPDAQRERMTAPCPIRTPNRRCRNTRNAEGQGRGNRKNKARTSTQSASLKRHGRRWNGQSSSGPWAGFTRIAVIHGKKRRFGFGRKKTQKAQRVLRTADEADER